MLLSVDLREGRGSDEPDFLETSSVRTADMVLLELPLALRLLIDDRDSDCEMLEVKFERTLNVRDLPMRLFARGGGFVKGMFSSWPREMLGVTEYAVSYDVTEAAVPDIILPL